jgi:hypothetical protein
MILKLKALRINRAELFFLFLIFGVTCVLRFWDLGYSHFYGDETKTLYLDKTVTAADFILDQRKGPVQFLAVWLMEKISGGYNEFYIRLPFAIAGAFSVLVLYLLARKFFGTKAALISTLLYSVSGLSVAFSRTAQYQSFLILFGLLSIYLFVKALETRKPGWYIISSLAFTGSMYSHYDAIFFLIPIVYMFMVQERRELQKVLTFFILPAFILLSVFYAPYIVKGYLVSNTLNYVGRRITGDQYGSNSSVYTFFVYNPLLIHYIYLLSSILYILFFRAKDRIRELFLYWFFISFIFFDGIVSNPGTHIQNYLIPLYIISGQSILWFLNLIKNKPIKYFFSIVCVVFCFGIIVTSLFVYVPKLNKGYPWKNSLLGPVTFKAVNKQTHHLYLYGFPYNRSWEAVKSYMYSVGGVRGCYTNDSAVMSGYYLQKLDLTPPGLNFLPQYYIDVVDNMEFVKTDNLFLVNYQLEKEIFSEGQVVASIYRLKK